ncbi:MAG: (E)-4-hydroxy-3-methylbut-2-enyl-diphosphate synthase [Deltaproteobacteria bacterium]|nr:(E)-4-hydroxy-3-methylbut-2-enyl-diphosphate synthase [Deltaproteobacteria bacterium]
MMAEDTIDPALRYRLGYQRLKTREVAIGGLLIGGNHPLLIQSMLSTPINQEINALKEIKKLAESGCGLIRIALLSSSELDFLPKLRKWMVEEGLNIPLCADIHFSPRLALEACEFFEKIRINPGNYTDRPKNTRESIHPELYDQGHQELKQAVILLAKKLKKHQRALRIGVNQGSLSTRMMERYGDTPLGMVNSALEMIQLFEEEGFFSLVVSLKSSNPLIVQKAYRLLAQSYQNGPAPALHLGVTEAGQGQIGRVKSLSGIATLLLDGIGDTIRVSLTEASYKEIDFAKKLLGQLNLSAKKQVKVPGYFERPLSHQRVKNSRLETGNLILGDAGALKIATCEDRSPPFVETEYACDFKYLIKNGNILIYDQTRPLLVVSDETAIKDFSQVFALYPAILFKTRDPMLRLRQWYHELDGKTSPPVGVFYPEGLNDEDLGLDASLAGALSEGLIDFLLIHSDISPVRLENLLLLLQATRSRIITADFIACPSCGRTLFDIEKATEKIKDATAHLKGVKIGIMGCVVNGPGEMADADFGYVGSGSGRIDLYLGQERVKRGLMENEAVDALVTLIKKEGKWIEKGLRQKT